MARKLTKLKRKLELELVPEPKTESLSLSERHVTVMCSSDQQVDERIMFVGSVLSYFRDARCASRFFCHHVLVCCEHR